MTTVSVSGGRPLKGRVRVPGDKSISHRALILAALAEGRSRIQGLSSGDDVIRSRRAVEALGAEVTTSQKGCFIDGGPGRLREPSSVLDAGNSGTTLRLMAGVCSGFDWLTVLTGDESLRRRPMSRVVEPLRAMGASLDGRNQGSLPPLVVRGGALTGIEYTLGVASAQVKSAILLAGLRAQGDTVVHQPSISRAHTEEMLVVAGADLSVSSDGLTVRLRPGRLDAVDVDVPGDPSQAAYWAVAASIVAGSDLTIEGIYLGPARLVFVDVLKRMGADLAVERTGEDRGDLHIRYPGTLRGTEVGGSEVAGLIDEIPVLAVAAAVAEGPTVFRNASELRVKESDRVVTVAAGLDAMGAEVEQRDDGMVVTGNARLHGAALNSAGDHRVAMALAVACLVSPDSSRVDGWEAVATSDPGFEATLRDVQC